MVITMEEGITHASMKDVKIGKYVLIDGIVCKVVDIDISSPGKHGSAKMRVVAIGIFDGQKKTLLMPSHAEIEVPVIAKRRAQVVSVEGDNAQLMDSETYDVFYLPIPEELRGTIKPGGEVEVMEAMGRRALSKLL
jgi:translation initiation factor 5A